MLKLLVSGSAPLDDYIKKAISLRQGEIKELIVQTLESKYILRNPEYITNEDVLICGASLYEELKKLNVRGQIIPLRVQTNDFLNALMIAADTDQEVNIVNYQKSYIQSRLGNKAVDADALEKIFNVRINQHNYTDAGDASILIDRLKEDGQKVVVGSGLVVGLAQKAGMEGILWYGKESITLAVEIAFNILNAKILEQSSHKRQNYILENFNEGVINLSVTGRIININHKAIELLELGQEEFYVSENINDILMESELLEKLSSGKIIKDKVVTFNNKVLLLNTLPIYVKGNFNGIVAIFSDAQTLQQQENKVRRRMNDKGHVAKYVFKDIIGESESILKAKNKAEKFARADSNVLILGESGTGKELFAQSIHNASSRKNEPFVAINCAAIPENLLESEFFGYKEGAFTGASKGGKPGLFELAHNGTVFLDEIGEIPVSLQAKLLRVLQEEIVTRVGSSTAIPIDARVISATNINLIEEIRDGKFRMDLYYRIGVLNLFLPKLSSRKGDIGPLLKAFTKRRYPQFTTLMAEVENIILPLLEEYQWNGNIREFENTIERLFAYIEDPKTISVADLIEHLKEAIQENYLLLNDFEDASFQQVIKDAELAKIKKVLIKTSGNRKEAAEILGISRSTLWRKLSEIES